MKLSVQEPIRNIVCYLSGDKPMKNKTWAVAACLLSIQEWYRQVTGRN